MDDESYQNMDPANDHNMTRPPWSSVQEGKEDKAKKVDRKDLRQVVTKFIPVVLFFMTFNCSAIGSNTIFPQYVLSRLQKERNFSTSDTSFNPCHVNESDPLYQTYTEIQQDSSNFLASASFFGGIPNMVSVIILGALSDKLGRKKVLYISFSGMVILTVGLSLLINLDMPLGFYFFLMFLSGCTGSSSMVFAAIYAHVADVTTKEQRAVVIATVEFGLGISAAIVNLSLGAIINSIGFNAPIIGLAVICVLSILFMIRVKESAPNIGGTMSFCQVIRAPFVSMKSLLSHNRQRSIAIILLAVSMMLYSIVLTTGTGVNTLYLMGIPFCWNSLYLGLYSALKVVFLMIVCIIVIGLLRNRVNNDFIIIAGMISTIATNLVIAFASSVPKPGCDVFMIFSIFVGIVAPLSGLFIRSQASKLVGSDEQGAIFGMMSTGETFATSFGPTISGALYGATVSFLPGMVFYFSAILIIIALVLVVIYTFVAAPLRQILYYVEQINE